MNNDLISFTREIGPSWQTFSNVQLRTTLLIFLVSASVALADRDTVWVKKFEGIVTQVKFSSSGGYLAACTDSTYLLDSKSGRVLKTFSGFGTVYFSHDEKYILRYRQGTGYFDRIDIEKGIVSNSFPIATGSHIEMAISDDEKYLVVPYSVVGRTYKDCKPHISIYDLANGKLVRECMITDQPALYSVDLNSVSFLDTNRILQNVYRSYDDGLGGTYGKNSNSVFSSETCDSLISIPMSLSFRLSNDKQLAALRVSSNVRGIDIFDFTLASVTKSLPINAYTISDMEFTADNQYLAVAQASAGENELSVWRMSDGQKVFSDRLGGYARVSTNIASALVCTFVGNRVFMFQPKALLSSLELPSTDHKHITPNPASDEIELPINGSTSATMTISVYDMTGRIVSNLANDDQQHGSTSTRVRCSDLPTGQYILRVISHSRQDTYILTILR